MPNIWVYVVGGIVAIGAIVSIQGVIGENEGTKVTDRQATTATANAAPIELEIPKPDASFDKYEICLLYTSPSPRDRG